MFSKEGKIGRIAIERLRAVIADGKDAGCAPPLNGLVRGILQHHL